MEYLWTTAFVVAAALLTFAITYFSLHGKLANIGKIVDAAVDVLKEISAAIQPDSEGKVDITPTELAAIKAKVDVLVSLIKSFA